MARWLDEGLRSEIKGEIKAWSEDLTWHLEVGGRAARGGRRRRVATVGRRGRKGMELTGGPYMAVTWEREKVSLSECAKSKRICLLANTPTRLGPSGPSGPSARVAACGRSGRIGQVLKWRKRTSSKIGRVAKTDKFQKWSSSI
jgi:hypothetical protein